MIPYDLNRNPIMLRFVVGGRPPLPPVPGWVPVSGPGPSDRDWIEALIPEHLHPGDTPGDKDPRSCHLR